MKKLFLLICFLLITIDAFCGDSSTSQNLRLPSGVKFGDGTIQSTASGGWTDGGTNVYTSTTTDNVGIGTTTPTTNFKLDIRGNQYVSGNIGIGTVNPRGTVDLGPTGTLYTQTIDGGTGDTIMGTSNNVGIGTSTAGSLLTVGSAGQLTVDSSGILKPGGYKSADGTTGVTVTTCTGYKNGLCISGT